MQGTFHDWIRQDENNHTRHTVQSLPKYGDNMMPRAEGDGILRLCNLNKQGIDIGNGFNVSLDIERIKELRINVQGYCKINKPWSAGNKARFDKMRETFFGGKHTPTVYSSRSAEHDVKYQ